jgi:hypothetical protein
MQDSSPFVEREQSDLEVYYEQIAPASFNERTDAAPAH